MEVKIKFLVEPLVGLLDKQIRTLKVFDCKDLQEDLADWSSGALFDCAATPAQI